MKMEYLHEFLSLTETLNYNETAERLFSTQSTISKHIQSLEEKLGVQLFERGGRNVYITEAGKLFIPYAKRIIDVQYDYTTALNNYKSHNETSLGVGVFPSMAFYDIPELLSIFKNDNPNIDLTFKEGSTKELEGFLQDGSCEMIFTRDTSELKDSSEMNKLYNSIELFTDEFCLLVSDKHPLAGKRRVKLLDFKDEPFVMMGHANGTKNQMCMAACRKAGFEPNVTYVGKRVYNVVQMARNGMGVAMVLKKTLSAYNMEHVKMLEMEPPVTSKIMLYYLKNRALSAAARHFLMFVEKRGSEIINSSGKLDSDLD